MHVAVPPTHTPKKEPLRSLFFTLGLLQLRPVMLAVLRAGAIALVAASISEQRAFDDLVAATGGQTVWGDQCMNHPCECPKLKCVKGHITKLHCSSMKLSGSIPETIGGLIHLIEIDLSKNKLHGSLPLGMCKLQGLRSLSIDVNLINGTLPQCIGMLRECEELNLNMNFLSGTLPESIGSLEKLRTFSVSDNFLRGSLPEAFGKCTSLVTVSLDQNR